MAVKHTTWPTAPYKEVKPVEPKISKYKKVVKKEVVVESIPVVEEEMTIEDILTTLEKKS